MDNGSGNSVRLFDLSCVAFLTLVIGLIPWLTVRSK